jgi:hypothetical protein
MDWLPPIEISPILDGGKDHIRSTSSEAIPSEGIRNESLATSFMKSKSKYASHEFP